MKVFQIPLRNKSPARACAYDKNKIKVERVDENGKKYFVTHKKINLDEDFFSYWSPETAYVLGIIYTDGNLYRESSSKKGRISVSQKNPELLNKIKALMNCDAKLRFLPRRQYNEVVAGELYILAFNSDKIFADLLKFGLTPRKSCDMNFPSIPQEYVRHFIRGCWDGDGSVYTSRTKTYLGIHASYTSGSLPFIQEMISQLESAAMAKPVIHSNKGNNPSYYFKVHGEDCRYLYHYLYEAVAPEQYLERKFSVFKRYFGPL